MNESSFGQVVHTQVAFCAKTANGSNVDDDTRIIFHVLIPHLRAPKQRATKVYLKRFIELRFTYSERWPCIRIRCSVVDKNVNLSKLFKSGAHALLGEFGVACIACKV